MSSLNPSKYAGVWYEFARTPLFKWEADCSTAKAVYNWNPNTKQMSILNSCYDQKGDLVYKREGIATPTEDSFIFDIEFNDGLPADPKSNYIVEKTNYTQYSIVTSYDGPKIKNLWVLTRVALPSKNIIMDIMESVYKLGLNPETLRINYVC